MVNVSGVLMGSINMPFIEPGTVCDHPTIGICVVREYDQEDRAVVEYPSKRYGSHFIKAKIPIHFLKVVNKHLDFF